MFPTYSERTRSVTGSSPAPAAVETEALVLDDAQNTTTTESLRVGLTLDLENIEREDDNLTNTDQAIRCQPSLLHKLRTQYSPAGGGVHNSLAGTLAESAVERVAVVLRQVVANEWLTTVLVHTLQDLDRYQSCSSMYIPCQRTL